MRKLFTLLLPLMALLLPRSAAQASSSASMTWFDSVRVGDRYRIYIALPDGYDPNAAAGYPAVYVLDGDWYFDYLTSVAPRIGTGVVGLCDQLADLGEIPRVIVVGVGYPTSTDFGPYRSRDFHQQPQVFRRFLKNELIPWVDENHNTAGAGARILLGHSSAGYFTTYDFLHHPNAVFDRHVAVSGNYDYDAPETTDGLIFQLEDQMYLRLLPQLICTGELCLGVGENEEQRFLRAHDAVVARLASRGYHDLEFHHVLYQGKDHGSVVAPAFREGLQHTLGFVQTPVRSSTFGALKAHQRFGQERP